MTTSEIEGDILDRASVQSSIRRQLGLAADRRRPKPAEQGVAEMTIDLHRGFALPLSGATLFSWHAMVTNGRRDLKDIGALSPPRRFDADRLGPIHAPNVHFEAPPSPVVPAEMKRFIG